MENKIVKIGVVGGYRGTSMINFSNFYDKCTVVAICDFNEQVLEKQKELNAGKDIHYYKDYDEMLKEDLDAVVLANYAHEHAALAIKALKKGINVFSEVLPTETIGQAVELVEAIEESGKIYAYGENYCFMPAPYEMRKVYREGTIGEFQYGEGEYVHNCESIWPSITYGDKNHWRNHLYSTFYCTHSIGPVIHITGLRPVSVIGIESDMIEMNKKLGNQAGLFGIELITFENGGIYRSLHGHLQVDSIHYQLQGSKGGMESAREITGKSVEKMYVKYKDTVDSLEFNPTLEYEPKKATDQLSKDFGHGGSDFYSMYNFVEKILGNKDADIIDIYEALDMSLPGICAYKSIMKGSIPVEIPNLRLKEERDKYRNDMFSSNKKISKDQWVPAFHKGEIEYPDSLYEEIKKKFEEDLKSKEGYQDMAFHQGSKGFSERKKV